MLSDNRTTPVTSRVIRCGAVASALALVLLGCSSGQETAAEDTAGSKQTGTIELALLQKQGDQQYFVDEAAGAKAKAAELGDVKVTVANLGLDSNRAISEVETAIARGVDGIIIVVPDQNIGPQVIDRARQAGIPLVAADDIIEDGSGKPAPFVGFDGYRMGQQVGESAAELYQEAGWDAASTRILAAWKQDLTVCTDRVKGAAETFGKAVEDMPEVIEIGTDNTPTGAQDKAGAVITANQDVEHWIVWGCNDENVSGVVTALQNSGVSPDDIIGVGLGAYLACKPWQAGQPSGMKSALFIDGHDVGASAVEVLVKHLRDGEPLPPETIAPTEMVDPATWKDSGLTCV
ncbi:MAG TPA: substrate-binding domain-containing protein [Actinopolymorphaceae bacterium]